MSPVQTPPPARQTGSLLRNAYRAMYRWPSSFGGFSAQVTAVCGDGSVRGTIAAQPGSSPRFDLPADNPLAEWARGELRMMVGYRASLSYDDDGRRHELRLEPGEGPGVGHRILVNDATGERYAIDDAGRITELTRATDGVRFTISILDTVPAPMGGWLSRTFSVAQWAGPGGGLSRVDVYDDEYVPVAGVMLPRRRRVVTATDEGMATREVTLEGHAVH